MAKKKREHNVLDVFQGKFKLPIQPVHVAGSRSYGFLVRSRPGEKFRIRLDASDQVEPLFVVLSHDGLSILTGYPASRTSRLGILLLPGTVLEIRSRHSTPPLRFARRKAWKNRTANTGVIAMRTYSIRSDLHELEAHMPIPMNMHVVANMVGIEPPSLVQSGLVLDLDEVGDLVELSDMPSEEQVIWTLPKSELARRGITLVPEEPQYVLGDGFPADFKVGLISYPYPIERWDVDDDDETLGGPRVRYSRIHRPRREGETVGEVEEIDRHGRPVHIEERPLSADEVAEIARSGHCVHRSASASGAGVSATSEGSPSGGRVLDVTLPAETDLGRPAQPDPEDKRQ